MGTKSYSMRITFIFLGLVALLGIAVVLNINMGSVNISPARIINMIFFGGEQGTPEQSIIFNIRLPRLIMAAVLGGGLALSGYLLQAFFRNPIAGPFVLGISSGARMFMAFAIIVVANYVGYVSGIAMVFMSFLGSLLSMGFVLIFAKRAKSMSMLLVVGIMIGYVCSAITDFIVTFAEENEISNLVSWSMGSFSSSNWNDVAVSSVIIFVSLILVLSISKPLSAYRLGEGYAQSMGINIKTFRIILILLSSILSATVTAFAGPISFVGIAVPHIAKFLFKTAKPLVIIPGVFFCGAIFCLYCDLIARTVFSPIELNIGTVTAVLGAPIVIWHMVSRKKHVSK